MRRGRISHLTPILMRAENGLLTLCVPLNQVVKTIAGDHRQEIIVVFEALGIHGAQRVRSAGGWPRACPSAVLLNSAPFRIQSPCHVEYRFHAEMQGVSRIGERLAGALSLPFL